MLNEREAVCNGTNSMCTGPKGKMSVYCRRSVLLRGYPAMCLHNRGKWLLTTKYNKKCKECTEVRHFWSTLYP